MSLLRSQSRFGKLGVRIHFLTEFHQRSGTQEFHTRLLGTSSGTLGKAPRRLIFNKTYYCGSTQCKLIRKKKTLIRLKTFDSTRIGTSSDSPSMFPSSSKKRGRAIEYSYVSWKGLRCTVYQYSRESIDSLHTKTQEELEIYKESELWILLIIVIYLGCGFLRNPGSYWKFSQFHRILVCKTFNNEIVLKTIKILRKERLTRWTLFLAMEYR